MVYDIAGDLSVLPRGCWFLGIGDIVGNETL